MGDTKKWCFSLSQDIQEARWLLATASLSPKPLRNSAVLAQGERTICTGDERVRSKYTRDRLVDCGALWPMEKNVQNRTVNKASTTRGPPGGC